MHYSQFKELEMKGKQVIKLSNHNNSSFDAI